MRAGSILEVEHGRVVTKLVQATARDGGKCEAFDGADRHHYGGRELGRLRSTAVQIATYSVLASRASGPFTGAFIPFSRAQYVEFFTIRISRAY